MKPYLYLMVLIISNLVTPNINKNYRNDIKVDQNLISSIHLITGQRMITIRNTIKKTIPKFLFELVI